MNSDFPGGLSEDKKAWVFPSVKTVNLRGVNASWIIEVKLVSKDHAQFHKIKDIYFDNQPIDLTGYINVKSGIEGGKTRETVPTYITSGKNIGKKNQTNVFTQALRDALSLYNKQMKKVKPTTDILPPPMLALIYSKVNPTDNTLYIQRKYNGVRCLACLIDDKVVLYSRKRLIFEGFDYLRAELKDILTPGLYLDGELYRHGLSLQDISGIARRSVNPTDEKLDYIIYDCFKPSMPDLLFSERLEILTSLKLKNTKYCLLADSFKTTKDNVDNLYNLFIREKYEGAMIRIDHKYINGYNDYHCKYLLKYKPYFDDEYEIVGWDCGKKGKAADALMIICKINLKEFPVTPALTLDERRDIAAKMGQMEKNNKTYFENNYLGKMVTVYYDELSKDNVPLRARTKLEIRDIF